MKNYKNVYKVKVKVSTEDVFEPVEIDRFEYLIVAKDSEEAREKGLNYAINESKEHQYNTIASYCLCPIIGYSATTTPVMENVLL